MTDDKLGVEGPLARFERERKEAIARKHRNRKPVSGGVLFCPECKCPTVFEGLDEWHGKCTGCGLVATPAGGSSKPDPPQPET